MFQNRLQNLTVHRLLRPQEPLPSPNGFVLYPVSWLQSGAMEQQRAQQQWIYQIAWEQARVMTRPSLPERDLLAVWN